MDVLRREAPIIDTVVRGRTLVLRCVPWGVAVPVSDDGRTVYRERFVRGAFDHIDPRRVDLRLAHADSSYERFGVGTRLDDTPEGLIGEFPVYAGERGDMLLDDVREGRLRSVSVGFVPGFDRHVTDDEGPVVERVKVKQLPEVSVLAGAGAYPGAEVVMVRQTQVQRAELRQWLALMRASC